MYQNEKEELQFTGVRPSPRQGAAKQRQRKSSSAIDRERHKVNRQSHSSQ